MEKRLLPPKINGDGFVVRKRTVADAYSGFETIDGDRERLREFLPWVDYSKSIDDQIWYINACAKEWDEALLFDYGIFLSNGDYIGNIGVHNINWKNDCCEIGYWICSGYEGQGYISRALRKLEEVLFDIGFNRIEIRCDPNNKKSYGVAERNGYTRDGLLRKSSLFRGNYRDTAVYSKLKTDLT